jgi:phosphoribosylformylglycinamidine cyclo-ligase
MYHVFNMGIGMVVICSPDNTGQMTKALPEAKVIGEVVKLVEKVRVIIK